VAITEPVKKGGCGGNETSYFLKVPRVRCTRKEKQKGMCRSEWDGEKKIVKGSSLKISGGKADSFLSTVGKAKGDVRETVHSERTVCHRSDQGIRQNNYDGSGEWP